MAWSGLRRSGCVVDLGLFYRCSAVIGRDESLLMAGITDAERNFWFAWNAAAVGNIICRY